ncbi:acyl carrier protein [Micromonospora sp. LOL_021]|uniref:acyl carrier protein n=1 Tax=Micromonospora sp. LOL_021 TaxID=3345417 RepID=UPI003A879A2D
MSETERKDQIPGTELVRGIWVDVLGGDDFTDDESFFEIGGDSFAALRVLDQIRRQTGVRVSLLAFVDDPTVAGLRSALTAGQPADRPAGLT